MSSDLLVPIFRRRAVLIVHTPEDCVLSKPLFDGEKGFLHFQLPFKLLLFLFEEFCAIGEVPEALCAVLDFCREGIARIERELSREPSKIISLPAHRREYKEAA